MMFERLDELAWMSDSVHVSRRQLQRHSNASMFSTLQWFAENSKLCCVQVARRESMASHLVTCPVCYEPYETEAPALLGPDKRPVVYPCGHSSCCFCSRQVCATAVRP